MRLVLLEMGIWRASLTSGDGSDEAGDGGDSEGDRTTSRHLAENVLHIVKYFDFNSGYVPYSPSVGRDGYLAGCFLGWGWQ
jgi:hypothetical protein